MGPSCSAVHRALDQDLQGWRHIDHNMDPAGSCRVHQMTRFSSPGIHERVYGVPVLLQHHNQMASISNKSLGINFETVKDVEFLESSTGILETIMNDADHRI